jgi:hypothetical protein
MTTETTESTPDTRPTSTQENTDRFQTLDTIGQLVSGLGWALVIVGGLVGLIALARIGVPALAILLGAPLYGILVVAYGQALQCVVAITRNTERTVQLLESRSRA